jgi:hypothetical protein
MKKKYSKARKREQGFEEVGEQDVIPGKVLPFFSWPPWE